MPGGSFCPFALVFDACHVASFDSVFEYKLAYLLFSLLTRRALVVIFAITVADTAIGDPMNVLSRDQQIQVIACLTEGMTIRATERITGIHRDTIMRFGAKVGRGCAELHDRMFVGIRTGRLELDELWAY